MGCGRERPKTELVRVVRTEGSARVDSEGVSDGRGAYICQRQDCFDAAAKKKAISRSLSVDIEADRQVELGKDFKKHINDINRK